MSPNNKTMFTCRTYFLSKPQFESNMESCGPSSLGEGTIIVNALPGFEGTLPESATVTQFQAHRIASNECGTELTIWVWMLGQIPNSPSEVSRLSTFYSENPSILSLPHGMDVTLILEATINATNATQTRDLIGLPSQCHFSQRSSSVPRLGAATTDCSAAFGNPGDAISDAAQIGLSTLFLIPGVNVVADFFSILIDLTKPPSLVDGHTLYDCISGFVEEAIDAKISAYDLRQIQSQVNFITQKYSEFSDLVRDAPKNMTDVYHNRIQSAFDFADDHTDQLASYFTGSPGPADPAGSLAVFSTFVTTQLLPFLKIKFDNYISIYGGTLEDTDSLRQRVIARSAKLLADSDAFYQKTVTGMITGRSSKISELKWAHSCDCYSPYGALPPETKCCDQSYTFIDTATGQNFQTSKILSLTENGDLVLKYAQDVRRAIMNRVESASRINIYQSTASRPIWPLLLAGGSGLMLQRRVSVEKNMCFSNSVDCDNSQAPLPQGHNYQDYNISDITIRSGSWVDYIRVVYTHRTTGQALVQEYGNPNGGVTPGDGSLTSLVTNPIVGSEWWSEPRVEGIAGVGQMSAFRFKQASGKAVKAGEFDGNSKYYKDEFSSWNGNVWLCGMNIHGQAGVRVHGIAPHWCYHEDYTVQAPPPPPSPSPPPPSAPPSSPA